MSRPAPKITVEEKIGEIHPTLEITLPAALPLVAHGLADMIKRLLAEGVLINDNGRIIPNPERMQTK